MAFFDTCVQVIVTGMPLIQGAGASLQIRITKDSRRSWLTNPRGVYDASFTYSLNDEVCYSATFYRSIDATPFSAVTPSEDGVHWTKSDKFDWAFPDASRVFILQTIGGYDGNITGGGPRSLFVDKLGSLQRYDVKDEAKLSPGRREVTLRDGTTVTGTDGAGNPVSYDFSTGPYKTFFGWLFYNNDSLTTWSFNRILMTPWTYSTKTDFECYWMGESKNFANLGQDTTNFAGRTANARQTGTKHITIEGGINRYENLVTSDVFPLVALPVEGDASSAIKYPGSDFTDWSGGGGAVQFVGGLIADQGCQTTDYTQGDLFRQPSYIGAGFGRDHDWRGGVDVALGTLGTGNGAVIACVTSNFGLHYMTLDTLLGKFAARAQMLWDSTKCSTPESLWSDYCSGNVITTKRIDGGNPFTNSGICYEAVMGSDPRCDLHVSEITTPVSLGWGTPLSDSLTRYGKSLFCKLSFPIDQTTKQQRLLLTSLEYLNTQTGSTLSAAVAVTDTTCTVASGSAFLGSMTPTPTGASAAIGQDATAYLAAGNTIYAQFQYQGIAQTIIVTNVTTNTITFTQKDSPLAWPVGAEVNPVQLLPILWRDGAQVTTEPATISAKHVELTVKGDDDMVKCPNTHGAALTIEGAFNARRLGVLGSGYVTLNDIVYNTKTGLQQQRNGWNPLTGGGSGFGHFCYMHAATVATATGPDFANFHVTHAAIDARNFYTSATHSPGNTDVCLWHDTVTGQVGWAYITNVLARNTFEIGILTSAVPAPVVGNPTDFLIGATTGSMSSFNDCGWMFDITIGTAYGTASDNVSTLITTHRLDRTDIYPGSGGGRPFIGMSITLPKYGIFTMQNIVWDGTHSTITLDKTIAYGAINVEGRIGMPDIASDGWAFAAYLYYMNSADKRFGSNSYGSPPAYDDDFTNHIWTGFRNQFGTDADRYSGAYTMSRLTVGPPEGATSADNLLAPPDQYGVAHYALAQAYARRFIGLFHNANRTNNGVLGNDGSLTAWSNGDSFIEQRDGAVRCYLMEGHELNELWRGNMTIRAREWPDFSAPLTARRFPVIINNGASTAGGAGGGGGNGGGGGSPVAGPVITTIDVPQFTADQNDFTISNGFTSPITILNFSSDALRNLTGIANGVKNIVLILRNVGTNPIILKNEDTGSIAANRFNIAGGDTTLSRGGMSFVYDAAISRWTPFAMVN